jgi:hypothetical protein
VNTHIQEEKTSRIQEESKPAKQDRFDTINRVIDTINSVISPKHSNASINTTPKSLDRQDEIKKAFLNKNLPDDPNL